MKKEEKGKEGTMGKERSDGICPFGYVTH